MSTFVNEARLAKLLRKAGPLTVKEIAAELGCSRPPVYDWIRGLIARGYPVVTAPGGGPGTTGPKPVRYGLR